jgi:subtilisin family serine protease
MIHLMLQVAAAACLSCRPNPTSPAIRPLLDVQAPQPIAGCARISLHVDLSTSAVTVQDGATCGQLVPERDTQPEFDASRRALRLPIVLRNTTTGYVSAPVRVSFTADSIYRYRNGQLVPGSGSTRALNADSASVNGRDGSWRYDTLLAAAGETQRIAPGARSRRLWLEFTGPELWLKPGGADADTTLSLRLDASGFFQIIGEVPPFAPDTIPSWVRDDSSLVTDPRAPIYRFSRNVVLVTFRPGTTQQQRAAAVGSVAGTVIGGKRLNGVDGLYLIQLPADATNDRVFDALRVLKTDAAVSTADLYWFMSGAATYLRPDDGSAGWTRSSWRVSRDSGYLGAIHPTWALEASNAARAWGCSLGDSLTRIAIVDQGLRAAGFTDLVANLDTVVNANQAGEAFLHGTHVAHVLAARGDNGAQMSGMMWRNRLSLYDASSRGANGLLLLGPNQLPVLDATAFLDALVAAANRGARVINISLGLSDTTHLVLPAPAALDSTTRRLIAMLVDNERVFAQGRTPLYVISTGNVAGRDAYYSGFPVLVDSLPDRVINVVGSNRARVLPWTPGNSSRIDVAAPAESIGTWGAVGGLYQTGTSFATPLVAGVAGLLFSFDPTLTPAEVKQLIIQGAQAGGLTAGGVPLLDAYESLRLAAQRLGAPLCGNRLWGDSGVVVAERVLANGPVDEPLTTVPAGSAPSYLTPMHGGKRLLNRGFATTWRELNWSPGAGWGVVTPGAITDTAQGGTYWSSRGLDHDRTRALFASITGSPSPGAPPTIRYSFTLNPTPPLLTLQSAPVRSGIDTSTSAAVCVKVLGSGSCGHRVFPSYSGKVSVAMSPDGNRGFDAITEIVNQPVASGPTNACLQDTFAQCTEYDIITQPTGPTEVFEIDFAANSAVQRWTVPGYVFRLGMSERNDEIVTTEGEQHFIQHFGWTRDQGGTGVDVPFVAASTFSPNTCNTVFRDVRSTTPTWGQVRRQVAVRPSTACTLDTAKDGIGGIAPRIRRTP